MGQNGVHRGSVGPGGGSPGDERNSRGYPVRDDRSPSPRMRSPRSETGGSQYSHGTYTTSKTQRTNTTYLSFQVRGAGGGRGAPTPPTCHSGEGGVQAGDGGGA